MKTMQKTGPAGPAPKETDAGGSFKKGRAGPKSPTTDHNKALEYPVKPGGGQQQAHNAARKNQPKVMRYLRG